MSILSDIFNDLMSVIFPAQCIGCNRNLSSHRLVVCTRCLATIPLTGYHMLPENPMELRLKSLFPELESVASQFFYIDKSEWRNVIHQIKYHHSWQAAYWLGYNYGVQLRESPRFQGIELVVPVPLHPLRQIKRGYNQSELIARGVAKALGAKVESKSLRRVRYNMSQVRTKQKKDRWQNVKGIFSVKHPRRFEERRILLVDDVFTTGATITECIEALRLVKGCRIWVATLAISHTEFIGNAL